MSQSTRRPAAIPVTLFAGLLFSGSSPAVQWQVVPENSRLAFVASQQGAEFKGQFDSFEAKIELDPEDPSTGRIEAVVQTGSVNTWNEERDEYLVDPDWFHVAQWPTARFETNSIAETPDGDYVATGQLTLREVTRPVTMMFNLQPVGETARLQGIVELARLEFGVGQGIWATTEWVGDTVRVMIDLELQAGTSPPVPPPP